MAAYGDDAGFSAWMESQGLALPIDAPAPAVLRQIGSNYIDAAYECRLSCSSRTGGFAQELAWPRSGHHVKGQAVPDDFVPPAWVNASYRAAYLNAVTPGWAITGEDATRQTRRERVEGAVEVEYFAASEAVGSDVAPGMPSDSIINGMVAMWLCSNKRTANSLFRVV